MIVQSCVIWLFYGAIIENFEIMVVNGFGLAMSIFYTIFYCYFLSEKVMLIKLVFLNINL